MVRSSKKWAVPDTRNQNPILGEITQPRLGFAGEHHIAGTEPSSCSGSPKHPLEVVNFWNTSVKLLGNRHFRPAALVPAEKSTFPAPHDFSQLGSVALPVCVVRYPQTWPLQSQIEKLDSY